MDSSGSSIAFRSALVRYAGYLLNWTTLGVGFAYAAMNPAKQGLHDKISGSHVVKDPRGPVFSRDVWAEDDQKAVFSELSLLVSKIKAQTSERVLQNEELDEHASQVRAWKIRIQELELQLSQPSTQPSNAAILETWILRLRRNSLVSSVLQEARQLVQKELVRAVDPETVETILRAELIRATHQADCSVKVEQRVAFAHLPVPVNNIPTKTSQRRKTKNASPLNRYRDHSSKSIESTRTEWRNGLRAPLT